ncbi:hypothetical protein [Ulvibacter antarcticus]|uniref:Uncharacterized protein n=1 Tax=Ulvibacter antarcticus TaxID=442714 RepID=A0A3L9YWZ7_9FLAO|nr:hypothetical protein [Ulvibacter antarcticus]RMA58952.1 hypothetical protein BXY75_2334 [Ulvibacter antarcticus]
MKKIFFTIFIFLSFITQTIAEPGTNAILSRLTFSDTFDDKADRMELQIARFEKIVAAFNQGSLQKPLSINSLKKINREQQAERIASLVSE